MGRPKRNSTEAKRVGQVIRDRLADLEITTSELARRSGFDVSQMHKIANGKCGTDFAGYVAIAGALGWTPAEFLGRVFPDVVRRAPRGTSRQPTDRN